MPLTYTIQNKAHRCGTPDTAAASGPDAYIEITGFEGTVRVLQIPERIAGLPVGRIGARAFADRADLEEVWLPAGLKGLGPFAFYNSPRLSYLALFDGIEEYNDGVIRHCGSLEKIEITMCAEEKSSGRASAERQPDEKAAKQAAPNYELLRRLLADNDRKLRLFVHMPDGDFSLIFPEYLVDFKEDTFARAFHFRIEGGGYASRECVTRRGVDFAAYDAGFYQTTVDSTAVAAEAAFDRLLYPYELREEHRVQYEQYLRETAAEILPDLIRKGDQQKINLLTERGLLEKPVVSDAIYIASDAGQAEICAVLLTYRNQTFPVKKSKHRFLLNDW